MGGTSLATGAIETSKDALNNVVGLFIVQNLSTYLRLAQQTQAQVPLKIVRLATPLSNRNQKVSSFAATTIVNSLMLRNSARTYSATEMLWSAPNAEEDIALVGRSP